MATRLAVRHALEELSNMYGKGKWWVDDSMKTWMSQLQDVSDADLETGIRDCLRKSKTMPTLARLREVMEGSTETQVGVPPTYEECHACANTGMRQLARHHLSNGKRAVWHGVAACDCPKGQRLAMGAFPNWRDVVKGWKDDKWTSEIYYATRAAPVIPFRLTVSPEVLERMDAEAEK